MHKIIVPEDITLTHPATGQPLVENGKPVIRTFAAYASEAWLNDRRVGAAPTRLYRWLAVVGKFVNAKPGDTIEIEDQDWNGEGAGWCGLAGIVRDPAQLYAPLIAIQLLPFTRAALGESA